VKINADSVLVPVAVEAVNILCMKHPGPIPVAARSQAWVCGPSLPGIVGVLPGPWMSVSYECCVLSASVTSLVRRIYTECDVFGCDHKASIMRRPWPIRGFCTIGKKLRVPLCYLDV